MSKLTSKNLKVIGLIMLLMGCVAPGPPPEPTVFGVPRSQWDTLTHEQQNEVIRGFNQRQQQAEVNAPLMAAVGTINSIAKQALEDQRTREKQKVYEKQGFSSMSSF